MEVAYRRVPEPNEPDEAGELWTLAEVSALLNDLEQWVHTAWGWHQRHQQAPGTAPPRGMGRCEEGVGSVAAASLGASARPLGAVDGRGPAGVVPSVGRRWAAVTNGDRAVCWRPGRPRRSGAILAGVAGSDRGDSPLAESLDPAGRCECWWRSPANLFPHTVWLLTPLFR